MLNLTEIHYFNI